MGVDLGSLRQAGRGPSLLIVVAMTAVRPRFLVAALMGGVVLMVVIGRAVGP